MKIKRLRSLVLGSGAAGLAAAVRLNAEGIDDLAVLTEGLDKGTSINTGSDKQTYYKLSLCGATPDSPRDLAETYLAAGSVDGDLALTEAATSTRAFFHLVDLGAPFPRDAFGQYAGYKTDHDPAKRATSCGPYTSREMCRVLINDLKKRNINVYEGHVAVKLLTKEMGREGDVQKKKILGVISIDSQGEPWIFFVENFVFAVGGPGGLYKTSVYPEVHTGAIGLALECGSLAKGLPESQFGLASFTDMTRRTPRVKTRSTPKEFRWNVSGSFMQVVPKFISTAQDGVSDPREFLRDFYDDLGDLFGRVFLKGYQWPFDVRKAVDGSSNIDLCVFYETAIRGRRVFLDYRENPQGFNFEILPNEARLYLENSGALLPTPFERLKKMNPGAVDLYRDWDIDLEKEPLEIAVCAQHNNGGLAVDCSWRSLNIEGLFPIGEVAGTHGVARPGGSALNAGQVGAFRAAERIGYESRKKKNVAISYPPVSLDLFIAREKNETNSFPKDLDIALSALADLIGVVENAKETGKDWRRERDELRRRMSENAAIFRSVKNLTNASEEAREQLKRILLVNGRNKSNFDDQFRFQCDDVEVLRNIQLCVSQVVYIDSIRVALLSGVGSRGSAIALDKNGKRISDKLPEEWKMRDEDPAFRKKILYSYVTSFDFENAQIETAATWRDAKPIPEPDEWFENVWRDFREGNIFV